MKQLMAISGLFFVLFVLMHAYGNLKIFGGPQAYAGYAHHLRVFGEPILPYEGLLWIMRVGLVVLILIHVISAFYLWHRAGSARGTRYEKKRSVATAYAARTMRWGGVVLLAFILFHLLQFTTKTFTIGGAQAYSDAATIKDAEGHMISAAPWNMMVASFSNWYMVLIYAIAVGALSFHVGHGVWSALQTIGWLRSNTRPIAVILSGLVGIGLFAMFIAPPLVILIGHYTGLSLIAPVGM